MVYINSSSWIRGGGFKTRFEDGGVWTFTCVFGQTPSPVRVLPLIQEGEYILFEILKADEFQNIIRIKINDYAILYLKVRPHPSIEKNYSKKFLPLKGTLRNKQCLLYAKLGCARLQLQASSHCTRWHELCDANQKRQFLKTEGFSSRRIFSCFACVFGQTPSPVGYSLLSKRESIYYLKFWRQMNSTT